MSTNWRSLVAPKFEIGYGVRQVSGRHLLCARVCVGGSLSVKFEEENPLFHCNSLALVDLCAKSAGTFNHASACKSAELARFTLQCTI